MTTVKGSKGRTYKIGPVLAGTVNISYKENTVPLGKQDVALVFEQLHKLLYTIGSETNEHS